MHLLSKLIEHNVDLHNKFIVPLITSRIGIDGETAVIKGTDVFRIDYQSKLGRDSIIHFIAPKFDYQSKTNTLDYTTIRTSANHRFRLAYKNEVKLCKSLKTQTYL